MINKKRNCSCECNNSECFSHKSGKCHALRDIDFGNKPCPFFKTKKQFATEEHKRQLREELANL